MPTDLDNDVKIQLHYDADLMRKYVTYFEVFAELMNDKTLSEEKHKVATQLFQHYRRMIMCMALKEIPEDFGTNDVLRFREIMKLLNGEEII